MCEIVRVSLEKVIFKNPLMKLFSEYFNVYIFTLNFVPQDFPRGPAHHEYREKFIRRRLQRMGRCRRTRRFAERDKRDGRREDEFLVRKSDQ